MARLPDRTALVVDGCHGIALGIARALAADGWLLALLGAAPEDGVADELASLRTLTNKVVYYRGEISAAADRARCLDELRREFASLHLLVNNANIAPPAGNDIWSATEDSFDKVFDANLKGPYFLTQSVARWMVDQRRADATFDGCIVNVSSFSADGDAAHRGDHVMARAGTKMATRLWTVRLAEFGIRVYEVRSGLVATDMTADARARCEAMIAEGVPLQRRWGQPADVGRAVAALARGDLPYATGQVVNIDGGMTVGRL